MRNHPLQLLVGVTAAVTLLLVSCAIPGYTPDPVETLRSTSFKKLTIAKVWDTGTDDPGEIDLYEDDEIAGDLSFVGGDLVLWNNSAETRESKDLRERAKEEQKKLIDNWKAGGTPPYSVKVPDPEVEARRWFTPTALGLTANVGVGTTVAGSEQSVVTAALTLGAFVEWDFIGFEGGFAHAQSPDSSLDDTERDDSAWYFGLRINIDNAKDFFSALFGHWTDEIFGA
jgi:hypothetical protein